MKKFCKNIILLASICMGVAFLTPASFADADRTRTEEQGEVQDDVQDELQTRFNSLASRLKSLVKEKKITLSRDQQKELYGLFKQATSGDNTTKKPFMNPLAKAKWKAWKSKEGMSREEAMQAYVDFATPLI